MFHLSARQILWMLTALLVVIGLIMVMSTTTVQMNPNKPISYRNVITQVVSVFVGLGAAVGISWLGTQRLGRTWWVLGFTGTVMLLLMALPIVGREVNGAWRWIDFKIFKLQPSEIAKLSVVLAMAWYMVRVGDKIRSEFQGALIPFLGFGVLAGLVFATKDLGSVIILALTFFSMLYFVGGHWKWVSMIGLFLLPIVIYVAVLREGYRIERMMAFINVDQATGSTAYHLQQSAMAVGSGGVFGQGLGQGASKLAYLPEKHTDFIFAVICQETGMLGATFIAGLFLALVLTGIWIATNTRDRHRRLLAIGATVAIGFQAFWHMLVDLLAAPPKGMTLPFISYGGSSMVVTLIFIGILDAVARQSAEEKLETTRIGVGAKRGSSSNMPPVKEGA